MLLSTHYVPGMPEFGYSRWKRTRISGEWVERRDAVEYDGCYERCPEDEERQDHAFHEHVVRYKQSGE